MPDPSAVLRINQRAAQKLVVVSGKERTARVLKAAEQSLGERLRQAKSLAGPGSASFTARHLQATLQQVKLVTRDLAQGVRGTLLDQADDAAHLATESTMRYMKAADREFKGVGGSPLALDEARMLERAEAGARSSILNRLASTGTNRAASEDGDEEARAKQGILERYGIETIGAFEDVLQAGLIAKKSWSEVRDELTAQSPFLQGAPASWAERIVRTETMGVYNRTNLDSISEAEDQLGDMVKILCMTDDDRTGWDSWQVHGQIRRPEEPFHWKDGLYMCPPNRPNDREVVVPHRIAWPIPPHLKWRTDEQVMQRYKLQRKKGSPGPRPKMTTVPLGQFGR